MMDVFAKCARCGAMVEPCDARGTAGGTRMRFWMAATTCTVDTDGGMALDLGGAAVLCPDCMQQYMDWLAKAPGERQVPGKGADGDSVERLAADMVKAIDNGMRCGVCQQAIACEYFGHGNYKPCLSGSVCRGYGDGTGGSESCCRAMLDDVHRRCEALGIDLDGDEDAER